MKIEAEIGDHVVLIVLLVMECKKTNRNSSIASRELASRLSHLKLTLQT